MSEPLRWEALAGKFLVFDGPDGCGKTTQMELFESDARAAGLVVRRVREPGGTPIGEQIREVLLAVKNEGMDIRCEMLLYMASRAQLVQQEIKPALAAGELVLCDRYVSSTLAYQGAAGGLPAQSIMQVGEIALDGAWPDLTIVFDICTDAAMQRLHPALGKAAAGQPGLFADRIEQRSRDYHQRVREGYLQQVERWPERYRKVDAGAGISELHQSVMQVVNEFFSLK